MSYTSRDGGAPHATVVLSALLIVLVLVVCFQCLQLYKARLPVMPAQPAQPAQPAGRDSFSSGGPTDYFPACSGQWLGERAACRGLTTGPMPSIEHRSEYSWRPCCGALGVPPPAPWFRGGF
jgi:hypothetical protein